jgi:hypothetical protein
MNKTGSKTVPKKKSSNWTRPRTRRVFVTTKRTTKKHSFSLVCGHLDSFWEYPAWSRFCSWLRAAAGVHWFFALLFMKANM